MSQVAPASPGLQRPGKLGTFGGVFTPSVLTILGVIMFLRFGFITGSAGLDRTILIVLIANLVSVLTSLSLAVIATNTKVHGGGDYYLISRSLGLEFGGAIGVVLYVAQSVSVGFYIVGFTEALDQVMGGFAVPPQVLGFSVPVAITALDSTTVARLVSSATCLLLFAVSYRGADLATKLQYVIMAALTAALISYFSGAWATFDATSISANRPAAPGGLPFWALFAIFFPAITGFTQGVSMSGDLKDPAKSLPRGTFFAVGVSLLVYLALPVFLAGTADRQHLLEDPGAASLKRVAITPWLVDVGVFAATLSSALASFMGAPRILRAMSRDGLFPGSRFFAQSDPGDTEPRRAIGLTFAIALGCIWVGNLNALATVVTMFFLLSYGALNYATFIEGFSRSPSFRPRFRLSGWRTSFVGTLVCGGVMLAIDPFATAAAFVVLAGVHRYLVHRDLSSPSGDARFGYYVHRIKEYLLRLRARPPHARDWRPTVLGVTRPGEDGRPLERFARAIGSEQGILTLAVVLAGPFRGLTAERERQLGELEKLVQEEEKRFFYAVTIGDSYAQGIRGLLMGHGLGRLRPNTLLAYWSNDLRDEYLEILQDAAALHFNVVLLHPADAKTPLSADVSSALSSHERRIDVWWRGAEKGALALLLAHLLKEADEWRGCEIRLLRIVNTSAEMEAGERELTDLVKSSRIDAKVTLVRSNAPVFDLIAEESQGSQLVFLGVGGVAEGERTDLARYNELLKRLPTTVLVYAWAALDVAV